MPAGARNETGLVANVPGGRIIYCDIQLESEDIVYELVHLGVGWTRNVRDDDTARE